MKSLEVILRSWKLKAIGALADTSNMADPNKTKHTGTKQNLYNHKNMKHPKTSFWLKNRAFSTLIITHFCVNKNDNTLRKALHYSIQGLTGVIEDQNCVWLSDLPPQ